MSKPILTTVTRLQGNNAALKRGDVTASGFELDFVDVPVLVQAFRRMVRGLEFDVCEMALTTYLCAREHGVRFTALPIFLVRAFHHGAILVNKDSDISDPKQLEGKQVGVNRGYTVTTGVWARAVLQDEYGVDLGKITWVLSGDEHVETYRAPGNVVSIEPGETIEGLLANGALAAAINIKADNPNLKPLIDKPLDAGLKAYRSRGHYPINHLIAVRDDVLTSHPGAAVALFDAFTESKERYLAKLEGGKIESPDDLDKVFSRILDAGGNPLPYGIDANRATLEELIGHAMTQGILTRPVEIESLFAPGTLTLNG